MYKNILFLLFAFIVLCCDWPFNTTITDDEIFSIEIHHDIVRVMPSGQIIINWSEITVENFKYYLVERKQTQDTSWTHVVEIVNEFQTSYVDTIEDDNDLLYRVGIVDFDDNIVWANGSTTLPRTTRISVPTEFSTIQSAFNSDLIDDGDTIFVNRGIYIETLGIAGKNILIKSTEGWKNTILMPTAVSDPNDMMRVLSITAGILDGFTIFQGAPSHGAAGGGAAIAQNGTIQNCFITGNMSHSKGGGIFILENGNLYNNIIYNNMASQGSGIFAVNAVGEIINNTILENNVYIGDNCEGLIFRNNILYSTWSEIDLEISNLLDIADITIDYILLDTSIGGITNLIVDDPEIEDLVDFKLKLTSPCIDAGHPDEQYNDIDGTRNDIGSYGGPVHQN